MSDLHPIPRTGTGEPQADVIFVHGLGGDPLATWWHDPDKPKDCWPFWLAEDAPQVQVHCLRYPADWTHWFGGEAMSLFDRAKGILNLMAAFELGGRPIVFICHSLGGLVVKQMLRQAAEGAEPAWQAIGERTRGVAFVATPHAGADLARSAERLSLVTQTTAVMADLTAHAPALRGLNEWFRGHVARTGLRVLCYYETRATGTKRVPRFGRWLGQVVSAGVKVVEEGDADPGVGVTPVPLDADHFGTCRPDKRDRPLCKDVLRLVRAVLDEATAVSKRVVTVPLMPPGRAMSTAPKLKPGTVFRDVEAPWCPEMIVIPPGEFMMGSTQAERQWALERGAPQMWVRCEEPQHPVRIAYSLAVSRYTVTFEEYGHFARTTGRAHPNDAGWGRSRRPVINVSWEDAKAYVEWLTAETGWAYRLPSEAEWEYACRDRTMTRYWWGDEITPDNANYGRKVGETSEVGSYPANPFGLYDMHGNIWEWAEDHWHDSYTGAADDGSAWIGGTDSRRVQRGGSWSNGPGSLRSASRGGDVIGSRRYNVGFRVARPL